MRQQEKIQEASQVDPAQFNLRNKGLKSAGGRIHKGCVKDAYSKLSIGSIPSNYESIIYRYEEKKGFGTGQKRFYDTTNMSEMLKTESELESEVQSPMVKSHASYSTKGYGPFIAKEKREWRKFVQSPGPGKYFQKQSIDNHPISKKRRQCYTSEREDFKRKELALNKQNYEVPGPGHYEVKENVDNAVSGCKSSFATKDKRQGYITKNTTPGPGCYQGGVSPKSDKKKEEREQMKEQLFNRLQRKEKKQKKNNFLPKEKGPSAPGPGYYDQDLPNFKPLYERIKISHNFVVGNKNRLDEPTAYYSSAPKNPAPCCYEIQSSFDRSEKKLIDMSSFMSESRRGVFDGKKVSPQGFYDSVKESNRNFHFNITGKWI